MSATICNKGIYSKFIQTAIVFMAIAVSYMPTAI